MRLIDFSFFRYTPTNDYLPCASTVHACSDRSQHAVNSELPALFPASLLSYIFDNGEGFKKQKTHHPTAYVKIK
jgi:hypothetical protein